MAWPFLSLILISSLITMIIADDSNATHVNQLRLKVLHSFDTPINHYMGDVLVVVHINYNAPLDQVKLYHEMWGPIFPRMVLFGEWDHNAIKVLHEHNLPAFRCPQNDKGLLAQAVMLKAVENFQHPTFKGENKAHQQQSAPVILCKNQINCVPCVQVICTFTMI